MRESHLSTSDIVCAPRRSSSIRLRKRRDEVKQNFEKNRISGEFVYRLSSDAVDNTDNTDDVLTNTKVDTLDPGPAAGGIQHNLRPLLRSKYIQSPLSGTEECLGSVWGTGGRGGEDGGRGGLGEGKIKHVGMIDQPPKVESKSSDQYDKR